MDDLPTRKTLLIRLKDADDVAAWGEFVDLYGPFLYNFCRKRGLQAADVEDVVQETLRSVAKAIQKFEYDPDKGTFRGWLFRITRSKLADYFRKYAKQEHGSGQTVVMKMIEETPSEKDETEADWDAEYHRHLFQWAAGKVKPQVTEQSWNAFWGTAVDERDPGEVAEELGMGRGAVYVAKSRVIARMRKAIESVSGELVERLTG